MAKMVGCQLLTVFAHDGAIHQVGEDLHNVGSYLCACAWLGLHRVGEDLYAWMRGPGHATLLRACMPVRMPCMRDGEEGVTACVQPRRMRQCQRPAYILGHTTLAVGLPTFALRRAGPRSLTALGAEAVQL